MGAGDLHFAKQQPLRAVDEVADGMRFLLLEFQTEGQLAARRLKHHTVRTHFHVIARRCRRGRRIALMARGQRERRSQT